MPVKEYKTRYVVFKVKNREELIKTLKDAHSINPSFRFKIVREYNGIIIVKCPHKAVPALRLLFENPNNTQVPKAIIIGVSGTMKKAIRKFCSNKHGA
ncbi:MAG: hypothetical protein FGF52_00535 [Candidatus Brockarchaeota archaeon]|nr:hypothetical protein [Candidatus Brockarchaeota archaeon]